MKQILSVSAFALAGAPALANPDCRAIEPSMPMWEIIKFFEEDEGGAIELARVNDRNCYEISGSIDGTQVEVHYDPSNGAVLQRNEG